MVRIDTDGTIFYSQQDEENLFNWANTIECIVSVERGVFTVDKKRVSEASLRDLISLLFRYGLPMDLLSELLTEQNKAWFKNPNMYWHKNVFGSEPTKNEIENGESVESIFGYWPKFSDGNITKISLDGSSSNLRVSIYYIDSDKNKSAEVGLIFSGVKDMELNEVREYNVLDELVIEKTGNSKSSYNVEFVGCFGATGQLSCKGIGVEYINA